MAQATCVAGYSWMYNSLRQSPCDVAASLAGVCTGGAFTISPLDPGYHYPGPSTANANDCRCNTIYYSLIAACSACQERNFVQWTSYTSNCLSVYRQRYPERIPDDTAVPHWAYLDVVPANNFDITAARAASGPESTAPPRSTFLPTTSATTFPTTPTIGFTTSRSATSTPFVSLDPPSSGKSTNVGAIVGGVVGGVVGLALVGLLLFLLLRKKKAASPPSSAYDPMMASQNPASFGGSQYASNPVSPAPYQASTASPSAYAPSSVPGSPPMYPSNYPSPAPTSVSGLPQQYPATYANQVPTNYTGTSATTGGQVRSNYNGMPEL
ncbi:hypothetical protein M413DRAFT_449146 [Hebeloma cylindrosporum]|uniref:Uncharacterized protein n=1 Tax=Hebeloma cylindrosporum TaxID=76867 RepID=A0A0C3BYB4_HEBCY|nr:hypothetical protein M413DRAFT_449146 [Hebeloma cylindrosporum h7]